MKKAMLSTLLILTASCSSDNVDDIKTPNSTLTETSVSTSITQQAESLSRTKKPVTVKDDKTFSKTYRYKLNGQKFTSNTGTLIKGSSVASPMMSESGVLKGSFVVITTKKADQLPSDHRVNKIAKDTYRLTPLKIQANLYSLYSDLLNNSDFSRVEIEIDFSQSSDVQSY